MLQITHETPAAERIRKARTALLLDVWRPGMPPSLERVSRAIAGGVSLVMRVKGPSYGG